MISSTSNNLYSDCKKHVIAKNKGREGAPAPPPLPFPSAPLLNLPLLRYFNFEPSFKLRWCRPFVIQINLEHDTIAV